MRHNGEHCGEEAAVIGFDVVEQVSFREFLECVVFALENPDD